jgi:uncharacterized protein YkwD
VSSVPVFMCMCAAVVAVSACGGRPASGLRASPTADPSATAEATAVPVPTPVPTAPPPGPSARPTATPAPPTPRPRTSPVPTVSPHVVDGVLVGSRQQELTNQARAQQQDLKPLAWDPCLADVAARHAAEMAAAGRIFHGEGVEQDMACGLGSRQTGENVGETSGGADDQRIFTGFMSSSAHRANILGPYRFIGTAWVVAGRTGYLAVEFG